MLFGEYEVVEEFTAFLCKACFASFSFAHRIVWFLKSMMHQNNPHNHKIRQILNIIQTIFKSEDKKNILERLHVAGSKKFVECLHKTNMFEIYQYLTESNLKDLNAELNFKFNRRRAVKDYLDALIDDEYYKLINEKEDLKLDKNNLSKSTNINIMNAPNLLTEISCNKISVNEIKLDSADVFLNTFKRYDSVTNDENLILTHHVKQIDMEDINLSSFLSNINFIDHLCNICEIIKFIALPDQNKILLNELKKVNKFLPSNVYLPFLKDSIRNYVIARIPLSEVKILKTKNRAPYLITIECFRLDELTYNIIDKLVEEDNNNTIKRKKSSNSSSNEEEDNLNTSIQVMDEYGIIKNDNKEKLKKNKKILLNNTTRDDFGMQKSQSYIDALLLDNPKNFIITNDKIITEKEKDNEKENTSDKIENLNKSDFYIQLKDKSSTKYLRESNNKKNGNSNKKFNSERNSFHKSKQNQINYLLESDVNISKPVIIKNIISQNTKMETVAKKKSNFEYHNLDYETDPEDYTKIDNVVKIGSEFRPEEEKYDTPLKNGINLFDKIFINNTNQEDTKIKSLSEEESDENSEVKNNDQYILKCDELNKINSYIEIIFGEKIEDQTERLRKNSPYGFLNTFKLMKIIVKSGEDLRQEQFATQLINEFYQIFKLEKVDCWVNTYEILATGNNVGIIEVVPNSISLDQLKRKTKHITSLKKFYDVCFSPINSDKYKKALKNFISSLAGYSLVCYFLQIKDRHNANILIDDEGHIIHIDFGYMLSNAPGKGLQFEKAPFKLTKEFVDVMGGLNSKYFTKFRKLLWK